MKWAVQEISVIRDSLIKVSTGDCDSELVFDFNEVTIPETESAMQLVDYMNNWANDIDGEPGDHE